MKKILIILSVLIVLFVIFRNVNFESSSSEGDTQDIEMQTNVSQGVSLSEFEVPQYSEEEKTYVNRQESTLVWFGENKLRNVQHTGNLDITSNSYVVLDEDEQVISGLIEVDMQTLRGENEPQGLITHLRSDDFFDVGVYKTARLDILSVENSTAKALLTIKDITQEVEFSFDTQDNTFVGELSFDRSLWDISTLSRSFFNNLGDSVVEDTITITFTILLQE